MGPSFVSRRKTLHQSGAGSLTPPAIYRSLRKALSERSGAAVVEFAGAMPFLVLVLALAFEWGHYLKVERQTQSAVSSVASIVAQSGPTAVPETVLRQLVSSWPLLNPMAVERRDVATFPPPDLAFSISSVQFDPTDPSCLVNCTYNPRVVWNYGTNNSLSGIDILGCTMAVSSSESINGQSIHPGFARPVPVVSVKFVLNYDPVVFPAFFSSKTIGFTAVSTVRSGRELELQSSGSALSRIC